MKQILHAIIGLIILSNANIASANPTQIRKIVKACHDYSFTKAQCAYTLATVEHETAHTWLPVKEAYWLSESWRKHNLRYYPYYGRGYVQLTWRFNYLFYEKYLGIPLVSQPDLALDDEIALRILFKGLRDGDYTGLRLGQFIGNTLNNARQARKVVNGLDAADKIARRAHFWHRQLTVY